MSSVAKRSKTTHSTSSSSTNATFEEDVLDDVYLTPEQEFEYARVREGTPDIGTCNSENEFSTSDDGTHSPGSSESTPPHSQKTDSEPKPQRKSTSQEWASAHDKFLRFLQDYSTSEWNLTKAEEVYRYLNASLRIVGPNDILGIYEFGDDSNLTIDSILNRLEHQSVVPAWSAVPEEIGPFLDVFEGFENLANCLREPSHARPLVAMFQRRLAIARKYCKDNRFDYWYQIFINFTKRLLQDITNCEELLSQKYVKLLIKMFAHVQGLFVHLDDDELKLKVPLGRGKRKTIRVKPDIILESTHIFLVGEVKKFGCHGKTHEAHRGSVPKSVLPKSLPSENDRYEGGKEDPLPGCSTETVNDRKRSLEDTDVHIFPSRSLGSRERYKVRCYLPQLLGQILSAMHSNQHRFNLGSSLENAMLGIAVEGFKLRFVKLVLRDHINRTEQPTVEGLLSGEYYKNDVYLTQEFNLFKKSHLRMFFKTFLAIYAECG